MTYRYQPRLFGDGKSIIWLKACDYCDLYDSYKRRYRRVHYNRYMSLRGIKAYEQKKDKIAQAYAPSWSVS